MAVSSFRGLASLSFSGGDLLSPSHGDRTKKKSYLVSSSVERSLQKTEKELRLKSQVGTLLDSMKWDEKGLAVAIAQNVDTGAVLMQGFADRDALATTISTQKAAFYNRSRSSLWTNEATSSNFINVHDIFLDCDRDSILYLGKPDGPTCHTGSETCYFSSVFDVSKHTQVKENKLALTTLFSLESTVLQRKAEIGATKIGKPSWTKRLLLDEKLLCLKIREEANELCQTLEEKEDRSRTASEMADVLYHAMVLLAVKDVQMEGVLEVLRKRFLGEKNTCNLISDSVERSLEKTLKELHSDLEVEALIDGMKWDEKGLVVAIAQNVDTGAILMQGFANRDALATTISSRKATFYSRSRSALWTKGETSKNFINVHDVLLDCDRDSVLYIGKPDGPTCHTGLDTCYFSSVSSLLKHPQVKGIQLALTTLYSLEAMVYQQKAQLRTQNGAPSWAKLLLDEKLLCFNIREKANGLCLTLERNEDGPCTASEMANVLYHTMILLAVKDVKIEEVLEVLRIRFSQSGIEEKNSRKSSSQK